MSNECFLVLPFSLAQYFYVVGLLWLSDMLHDYTHRLEAFCRALNLSCTSDNK